ncbi:MAG TPA: hypothetical protein VI037_04300 [Nitrososphaera sp.]
MVGPLIGKLVLNVFDYYALFRLAALTMAVGIGPSVSLRSYGWPAVQKDLEVRANSVYLAKEMATHPTLAGVILYYAMTFGVVLAVYPAYMSDASLSNQGIELMFFVCGISRFVTLLLLVTRISKYGVPALAKAVLTTAAGTIISFSSRSVLSFAVSIALFCLSTSIFYPVSFRLATMNMPSGHLGSKLGFYNTLFGAGWMAGPIAAGFASDTFGSGGPYLAFFIPGRVITAATTIFRKDSNHF